MLFQILDKILVLLFGAGYSIEVVFFFCFFVFMLVYILKRK